jgi:hypothetical protein
VFAACSHCPPLDPQNDQSLVAARFVPVNQVVQFELVDFSGIELGEAVTYVLEEPAQFIPVIATDELACGAPLGLIRRSALAGVRLNHGPNVRGELSLARDIGTYRATTGPRCQPTRQCLPTRQSRGGARQVRSQFGLGQPCSPDGTAYPSRPSPAQE